MLARGQASLMFAKKKQKKQVCDITSNDFSVAANGNRVFGCMCFACPSAAAGRQHQLAVALMLLLLPGFETSRPGISTETLTVVPSAVIKNQN